ncbi:hypothetical protein GCM10027259_59720 [Micromonospora palomenae]
MDTDASKNLALGEAATQSANYRIRGAGLVLAQAGRTADGSPEANRALIEAQEALAGVCISLFGNGPW